MPTFLSSTTSTCTYRMTLRLNIRSLDFGACVERKVRTSQIEGIPLTIEDVRTLGIVQQLTSAETEILSVQQDHRYSMILANESSRISNETAEPSTRSKNSVGEDETLLELNPVSLMLGAFSMIAEDQQETNDLQQSAHKRSNVDRDVSHHTDGTEDNTDSSYDTSFLFPSEHQKEKDSPDSPVTTTTTTTTTTSLTPPSASCSERRNPWRWVTDESNGETKLEPHILQKLGIESLREDQEPSTATGANDDKDNHDESSTSSSLVALEVTRNFVDSLETSNHAGDAHKVRRTSRRGRQ